MLVWTEGMGVKNAAFARLERSASRSLSKDLTASIHHPFGNPGCEGASQSLRDKLRGGAA